MGVVMGKAEVSSVYVNKCDRKNEDHHDRNAEEDHDQEKIWLLGRSLLDFHAQ